MFMAVCVCKVNLCLFSFLFLEESWNLIWCLNVLIEIFILYELKWPVFFFFVVFLIQTPLCPLLKICPLCSYIHVLMRQWQMAGLELRTWLCPLPASDKSDAPSRRLCCPFISYTLLRWRWMVPRLKNTTFSFCSGVLSRPSVPF